MEDPFFRFLSEALTVIGITEARAVVMFFSQKDDAAPQAGIVSGGCHLGYVFRVPCAGNEFDWIVNEAVRCAISNPVSKEH